MLPIKALLFLSLSVAYASAEERFEFDRHQRVSHKISPCKNFLEHVCNFEENHPDQLFKNRVWSGFRNQMEVLLVESKDSGLERIRELFYAEVPAGQLTPEAKKQITIKLTRDKQFVPYMNALIVKLAVENKVHLTPEGRRKADEMVREIRLKLIQKFRGLKWLSNREEIVHALQIAKILVGIPQEYIDHPEYAHEMIESFERDVIKFYGPLAQRGSCNVTCKKEALSAVLLDSFHRYNKAHSNRTNLDYLLPSSSKIPSAITGFGGRNVDPKFIFFYPDTMHVFNVHGMAKGLLYSTAGLVIGHEFFHSVWHHESTQHYLREYVADRRFMESVDCYSEYYSNYYLMDNSTSPPLKVSFNGLVKMEEGYADIQAARLLMQILSEDRDYHEQLKWFFYGLGSLWCPYVPGENRLKKVNSPHMPAFLRTNAVLRQLPEFSTAFSCREGDDMYRAESICEAFPVN
ncbi:hypothetical protein QR680_008678 [Steinernema hermaphroditum]|uniref:Peptidase M13 C-terminal domain-containing protein n=1 Tax=Steinernema hermaphroditum TaxID=289476 RepID=A0AA39IJR3_9BILA|nr:hypothetical protein QR680_008678 [Steinernema hermaphroditum]